MLYEFEACMKYAILIKEKKKIMKLCIFFTKGCPLQKEMNLFCRVKKKLFPNTYVNKSPVLEGNRPCPKNCHESPCTFFCLPGEN